MSNISNKTDKIMNTLITLLLCVAAVFLVCYVVYKITNASEQSYNQKVTKGREFNIYYEYNVINNDTIAVDTVVKIKQ